VVDKRLFFAIVLSWAILGVLLLSTILSPDYSYFSYKFLISFIGFYLIFYSSCFLSYSLTSSRGIFVIDWKHFVVLFFFVSVLALAFRAVDRFYFRPVEDFLSVSSYRESREGGSNLFSVLGVILSATSVVLYSRLKHFDGSRLHGIYRILWNGAFYSIILVILDVSLSASRGILLLLLVVIFSGRINFFKFSLYSFGLVVLLGAFFVYRYSSLASSEVSQISHHFVNLSTEGYAKFVPVSDWFKQYVFRDGVSFFWFFILQAAQYLTHGIFEFAYIFSTHPDVQFDPSRVLPQLAKLFKFESELERENFYYSLAGTAYIGFGVFYYLVAFSVGAVLGAALKRSHSVSIGSYNLSLLCVFLVPFVNSFGGYDAVFLIFSIFFVSSFRVSL